MITPSYSLTATAQVLPRLALDFTTAALDPRITFTRALNTATRVNSSGLVETVNADVPRFDYNPSTLTCLGLLMEETRTNQIYPSEDMAAATWGFFTNGAATATATAASGTSPAGTNNATKIALNASGADQAFLGTAIAFTAGVQYAGSFYVKAFAAGDIGKIIAFRHAGSASYQLITLTTSWQRVIKVESNGTTNTGTFDVGIRPGVGTSSGAVDFLIWGAQYEQGAFATSYIPTTVGASVRSIETAVISGTNFTSWYDSVGGTLYGEGNVAGGTNNCICGFTDGTTNNRILIRRNSDNTLANTRVAGAGGSVDAILAAASVSGYNKHTLAFVNGDQSAACNGQLFTGIVPFTPIPTVSELDIGWAPGSTRVNGHVVKIMYWPQRLVNAELQAFSS